MENGKSLSPSESAVIQAQSLKTRDKIVVHLGFAPMALIAFICAFSFMCVVITTVGQSLFCLVAMTLSLVILERSGRAIYPILKNDEDTEGNVFSRVSTRKLLAYYAGFIAIVLTVVASGAYLNTHYLDQQKAESNRMHFERILRMD